MFKTSIDINKLKESLASKLACPVKTGSRMNVVAGYKWASKDSNEKVRIGVVLADAGKHSEEIVVSQAQMDAVEAAAVTAATTEAALESKLSKYHGEITRGDDGKVDLVAEMRKHPDALWIKVKAIEADRENDNGDYFSKEEVLKAYKSFEGVPVFTNHENNKVEAAKGKVVLAEYDELENAVYCTMFVDRTAHPGLCRAIEEGYVTDVSMGTQVDYSTCSVCNNRAITSDQYCPHVKTLKGRNVDGKKVYEKNFGLKFIEISVVTDGACPDCTIREIIDPAEMAQGMMMRAADTITDFVKTNTTTGGGIVATAECKILVKMGKIADLYTDMVKTALMTKDSGQAEIQKLNQAMDLLEDVSRTMLDQRQYIDLEFMSKLVDVLADLQHVNDELVDQGYGSVGSPGAQAAPAQSLQVPPMPESQGTAKEPGMEGPKPSVAGPASSGVGSVTEPATASRDGITHISVRLKELHQTAKNILEEEKLSRGGEVVNSNQKNRETVEKLARIWENPSVKKFHTEVEDGEFKLVVGAEELMGMRNGIKIATIRIKDMDPDIQKGLSENTREMASQICDALKEKYAKAAEPMNKVAEKAPVDGKAQVQETMELQLADQKPPLHSRTLEVREEITEKQLAGSHAEYDWNKRQDKPRTSITEKQLRDSGIHGNDYHEPQDKPRLDTQELQLRDKDIKGNSVPADPEMQRAAGVDDQHEVITEGQLQGWLGADKPEHPTTITEDQLRKQQDPLGRRIDAKKALAMAMTALVRTAIATGATPEELVENVAAMTSTPKYQMQAIEASKKLASADLSASRNTILKRASFHGPSFTSSNDVSSYLLGSISDVGLESELGLNALEALASQKNATKVLADAITASIQEESKPATKTASIKDILREAAAEMVATPELETVKVLIAEADVKADPKDKEAFAAAAFDAGIKLAEAQNFKVANKVHVVKTASGMIEVAMTGTEQEAKTASLEQRSEARKNVVEAQAGGMPGMPGGAAGVPNDPAAGAGGGTTLPAANPADPGAGTPPVASIGEGGPEGGDEEAGGGEANPPGTTCPVCGSDDVNFRGGDWDCNNCGGAGTMEVMIKVKNWPGSMEDQGAGAKADEGGMGGEGDDMGDVGGEGIEMPPVGIQSAFRVTPEMVKIAKNKPIGSFCPHCNSSDVKLASKSGAANGECNRCGGTYRVDTYVDVANMGELTATMQWQDMAGRTASSKKTCKLAGKALELDEALKAKGLLSKYAKADALGKAMIIADLHDAELIHG